MEPKLDLYEAIRTTRAVRKLRPDPIPDDVLRRVLEAATYAPSGGNRQPWRIVAVTDPDKKKVMRDLYRGPWQAYRKSHASALAKLPDDVRRKFEKI